jgi:2-iminobutanoate/2-iminopropanoate deaminase
MKQYNPFCDVFSDTAFLQRQILQNLNAVLKAGGSSLRDAIKINIFLTDMADFPAVNEIYDTFFSDPKPVSTPLA